MKIRNIILIVLAFLLWVTRGQAHVQKVHSESQFYRTINRRSIALSFFYIEDKDTRKDPSIKSKISSSLAYLERMSRLPWYDDGDCLFVTVNVVTDELCSLMHSLGIKQLPCCLLFYNSVPIRGPQGQLALLTGFVPRNVLEDFIDRYAGGTIEDNVKERAEQRRIAREDARLRYEYYSPYFYWGYPYWGGCGCPNFGCGFGFGGCY
jgi:hypothetical protein